MIEEITYNAAPTISEPKTQSVALKTSHKNYKIYSCSPINHDHDCSCESLYNNINR